MIEFMPGLTVVHQMQDLPVTHIMAAALEIGSAHPVGGLREDTQPPQPQTPPYNLPPAQHSYESSNTNSEN
jgi:hypothetical protein